MVGVAFPDDLTEPERLLWAAFPRGAWVDRREGDPAADDLDRAPSWGPGRVIRAEVVRALLLGAGTVEPGYAAAVRLRGVRVSGRLDLMGATVGWPLVCEHCSFDAEVRLVESTTKTVRFVDCRMPSLNGTRMRLDGILNLAGSAIDGLLRLDQAKIDGQVSLRGADIGRESPGMEAVAAYGLVVDGGVECIDLTAHGTVAMRVARITGSIDLTGARISCPGGLGLAADYAEIGGRLGCRGMAIEGQTSLHNTRVAGNMVLSEARLENPAGQALSAGGLTVDGGVFVNRFTALGEIRMVGARLGANLTLTGSTLSNPGGIAIDLDRAAVQVCHGTDLTCRGRFSLTGARIASELELKDARLDSGEGDIALAADGAVIDGAVVLTRVSAHGEVNLRTARIGRSVLLTGASLDNQGRRVACRLSGADVAGDVVCNGLTVTGGMRLTGSRIGGRLSLDQVRLENPAGTALSARGAQVGELSLRPAAPITGTVDLSHARVEVLIDDPDCWPDDLSLDGLTYQALEPRLPARRRLSWLDRDPRGHQSQPYEHLAAYYTGVGLPGQARAVLYERERRQRRAMTPFGRTWGVVQDVTVGYGYQPWRAVVWLAVLLGVGTVVFAAKHPPAFQAAVSPHFNAFVYTLDLLLPVVDLGQKHAFNPGGAEQWLSYLLIAAGWILVTTVAAGAARVLTRR
jgi:adhesin HecA-like repeat protein